MDRDNAKARRESGFNEDDDVNDDDDDEEELVSKKRRRLFLRRLGSQFRVNARSEMDIEEEEDALTTFLCCKKRLLIGKGHSSSSHREDVTCFPRRSMETNATIIALGGQ